MELEETKTRLEEAEARIRELEQGNLDRMGALNEENERLKDAH